ncbi:hypothetical protein B0T19DRAFT_230581 [Cercophora scortea]|uniref:Nephrocystin 3-like N-terminal domain-containing protein n=1 Tax=Cercophora scortea TaxID=314031 RepID=A0AAE0IG68_9PEZI|nr:hypothetical protein B0T19DRAFT_230581 [Cercophora scortea]
MISERFDNDEFRDVFAELVSVNPTNNHDQAWGLHEPHTSEWLMRSDEWASWMDGDCRLLWIHGIPGAGKTILCSYVIETLSGHPKMTQQAGRSALAYYYCHHSRSHDSDTGPFLAWIFKQLCEFSRFIPPVLKKRNGRRIDELEALDAICQRFDSVFIAIDALDECRDRSGFLKLLKTIMGRDLCSNLKLLVTSRDEIDIRRGITSLPSRVVLSMTNHLVDEDIRKFVRSELQSDPKFTRWPQDLRDEIEQALSEGAKGMFRWASCQIQILRRLNQRAAIRKALQELPETLDETYERIVNNIPKESRVLAFRALALLCAVVEEEFAFDTAELLTQAVLWAGPEDECLEDDIFDVEALHEVCFCLVTISPNKSQKVGKSGMHIIKIAHYTVKEFLRSDRIRSGPVKDFYLSRDATETIYVTASINALIRSIESVSGTMQHFLGNLWSGLKIIFNQHAMIISRNEHLFNLVCLFLDPENGHMRRCVDRFAHLTIQVGDVSDDPIYYSISWLTTPRSMGPAALLALMCGFEIELVLVKYAARFTPSRLEEILETTIPFGNYEATLLGLATLHQDSSPIARRLLSWSSNPALISSRAVAFLVAIQDSAEFGFNDVFDGDIYRSRADRSQGIPLLIGAGASLNNVNARMTPLQLAIIHSHGCLELVELMLEAGADPNAVGESSMEVMVSIARMNVNAAQEDKKEVSISGDTKPLDICRMVANDPDDTAALERLLVLYGAHVD